MCLRYALVESDIMEELGIEDSRVAFVPSYNLALTASVPVIREVAKVRTLESMEWGFYSPRDQQRIGNTRLDTVYEKPMFADAFKMRRCIVPASCFYEWRKEGRERYPMKITVRDRKGFALAGIWRESVNHAGTVKVCSICTTEPNELVTPIHNRMPVILAPEMIAAWLQDRELTPAEYEAVKRPFPGDQMAAEEVDRYVSNVRNQGSKCWEKPHREEQGLLF
jgi:putative SOS response-associated peptidase YedK